MRRSPKTRSSENRPSGSRLRPTAEPLSGWPISASLGRARPALPGAGVALARLDGSSGRRPQDRAGAGRGRRADLHIRQRARLRRAVQRRTGAMEGAATSRARCSVLPDALLATAPPRSHDDRGSGRGPRANGLGGGAVRIRLPLHPATLIASGTPGRRLRGPPSCTPRSRTAFSESLALWTLTDCRGCAPSCAPRPGSAPRTSRCSRAGCGPVLVLEGEARAATAQPQDQPRHLLVPDQSVLGRVRLRHQAVDDPGRTL
jgi:hypothetical protein